MRKPFASLDDLVRRHVASSGPSGPSPLSRLVGFGANPGALDGYSFVPPGARGLVVILHGCQQDARGYDRGTGWTTLAEREGFAVLAPEQRGPNNPMRCFNWFDMERGRAEAESIAQMVRHLVAAEGLDARRVYVSGLSAGGAMANFLLAAHPALFAGGAVLAGLPFGAARTMEEALLAMRGGVRHAPREWGDLVRRASNHRGPWPSVSIWQGAADTTVAPRNAADLAAQWLDLHGITGAPRSSVTVDGARRLQWHDGAGRTAVEAWTLEGLAHGAPIGPGVEEAVRRGGVAGPFILDAGIHSTWHSAAAWGLADPERVIADAPEAAPRPREAPLMPDPLEWAQMSPEQAIERAMRLAGRQ
ncbi:extracellular catalytic domain type 1 short-chain-length polyhydroxyalkanoate depolymerase [Sabulicella glaciei]|uniref:PHB depolymerase family esterase n=1 Tax=Sabulicella glaciei TaxID=2984948 RepID=A0ABT3NZZ7_9PROT|nr:PHB depolymerase family esterase [Roseococcus sp. MDT2-1-1]